MNEVKYSECCNAKIVSMYLDEFRCSCEMFICTKCGKVTGTTYKTEKHGQIAVARAGVKLFIDEVESCRSLTIN